MNHFGEIPKFGDDDLMSELGDGVDLPDDFRKFCDRLETVSRCHGFQIRRIGVVMMMRHI